MAEKKEACSDEGFIEEINQRILHIVIFRPKIIFSKEFPSQKPRNQVGS